MLVDAMRIHSQSVGHISTRQPRRIEMHPLVLNDLLGEDSKLLERFCPDGFIRFMGVRIIVSTDFSQPLLVSWGNIVQYL